MIARNLNPSQYVTVLYQTLMDRTPAQSELDAWVGQMNAGYPREHIFHGFVMSEEFAVICAQFGIERGVYTPPPFEPGTPGQPGQPQQPPNVGEDRNISGDKIDASIMESFMDIIDEYKEAVRTPTTQVFEYEDVFPNVNPIAHFYNRENLNYSFYDISGNGVPVLLIGSVNDDGSFIYYDFFIFNGSFAEKQFSLLQHRSSIRIFTDGTIHFYGSTSARTGHGAFYRISNDGMSLSIIEEYEVDGWTYPNTPYIFPSGLITFEEYEKKFDGFIDVNDINWISLQG